MRRPTPATRSLTEVPGWTKKTCERCEGDFWSVPSQAKYTRYCAKDCRHEAPEIRLWKNTIKAGPDDCWICTLTPGSEYPSIKVNGVQTKASHVSLEIALGRPITSGLYALHSCDKPKCVNPAHLHEGTQQKNVQEAVERGRNVKGITHGKSVFTTEQVIEIRKLKGTILLREAAQSFNVSISAIHGIWSGRRYKEIGVDDISPQQ